MAHTKAYTYLGAIDSDTPGVKKHMWKGALTLSTDGGDAYSRTDKLTLTFNDLAEVTDVLALYSDVVSNTGQVPVYSAVSGNELTIGLLEAGNAVAPLPEKAEEVHDQIFTLYAIVVGV